MWRNLCSYVNQIDKYTQNRVMDNLANYVCETPKRGICKHR